MLTVIGIASSSTLKGGYPRDEELHEGLFQEPHQEETSERPFTFVFRGHGYAVQPRATFELTGIVVSHNNTTGIGDAYHTSDSVDFRDLCVVWGDNADSDLLGKVTFWSEPWTCFIKMEERATYQEFNLSQLANMHLLTDNDEVRRRVLSAHRGDQIRIRGLLVDYTDARYPGYLRETSLTRDDRGNGACEVVFIDDFEILDSVTPIWNRLYDASWSALPWVLFLRVAGWLLLPWLRFRLLSGLEGTTKP